MHETRSLGVERVLLEDGAHQLLGGVEDRVGVVVVDGDRAAEGSELHAPDSAVFLSRSTSAGVSRRASPGASDAEPQRPEGHPLELLDGVADRLAHAPDLPLAALGDRELEQARLGLTDPRGARAAVVQLHPLAQPPQRRLGDRAPARRGRGRRARRRSADGSGGSPARRRSSAGSGPVVVGVEPADRIQPPLAVDELGDDRAAVRVARRRDDARPACSRATPRAAPARPGRPSTSTPLARRRRAPDRSPPRRRRARARRRSASRPRAGTPRPRARGIARAARATG